jgi:Flp pilus assembly protein TadG
MRAMTVARRHRGGQHGQALVEFALASVVLATLVCGAGQVGAIVFTQLNVDNASRDAARVASLEPDTSQAYGPLAAPHTTAITCSSPSTNPVCNAAWNAAGGVGTSNLTVTIAAASNVNYGTCYLSNGQLNTYDGYVTVTVSTHTPIFVPFVDRIFTDPAPPGSTNGTRTLTSTTVMRIATCPITNGK